MPRATVWSLSAFTVIAAGLSPLGQALAMADRAAVSASPAPSSGTSAVASRTEPQSGGSPAVVGPTLHVLSVGEAVGVPLACGQAISVMVTGASAAGLGDAVVPVASGINSGCSTIAAQGATGLQQAQTSTEPLVAANPVVNPLLQTAADTVTAVGTDYGPQLAPLGPTVVGVGATIGALKGH